MGSGAREGGVEANNRHEKVSEAIPSLLVQAVLLDDLAVMEHVELLRGILAGEHHDALLAARVVGKEIRHIQHLIADDDPAVLVGLVLGHLLCGHGHGGEKV